jgi:hypothetical protein
MKLAVLTASESRVRAVLISISLIIALCWVWMAVFPQAGPAGSYEWTIWLPFLAALRIGYHAYESPHLAAPIKADLRRVARIAIWIAAIVVGYLMLTVGRGWIEEMDLKTITSAGLVACPR